MGFILSSIYKYHHHIRHRNVLVIPLLLTGLVSLSACEKTYPPVTMPDEIFQLEDETIRTFINMSDGYLLVHFTSYDPDCGYCVESNPFIDNLAKHYISSLKVARIHWEPWTDYADKSGDIKKEFHIRGIPKMILYKDGEEIWQGHGYTAENLKSMENQLKQCCG